MPDLDSYSISTDKQKMDLDVIHGFLTHAYWAEGRSRAAVQKTIDASLNFGLYIQDRQVGYARVLTDYAVFAYLMDVFILPEFKGYGYSKILLETVFSHPKINVSRWMLATKDAHSLYAKFGFSPLSNPDLLMEKLS